MKSVRLRCVVPTILSATSKAELPLEENEENLAKMRDANREENEEMHELEVRHTEVRRCVEVSAVSVVARERAFSALGYGRRVSCLDRMSIDRGK